MRKPLDVSALMIMVLLCLIWGLQQVAIKAVADDMAPVLQVSLRCGVAAVLVWLVARFMLRDCWLPGLAMRSGLLAGLLFALEFLLVAEGLRWTTASHMVVFLYTAPIFAAIGLHLLLPDERLTPLQWSGILLAFSGILITFLRPQPEADLVQQSASGLLGDLMGLLAGLAWGLVIVTIRASRLSEAPPTQALFHQLVWGFVVLMVFAALSGQLAFTSSPLLWTSLGFQAIGVGFFSYLVWLWLMKRYLVSRLGVLSFMTPLFGVLMGALLLNEPLEPIFLLGALLVLMGVLIVNGQEWLRQWLAARLVRR